MTSATPQRIARHTALTAPALVACDIDGTLLRTGEPVTPAVRDAVDQVRAAGHHIVLATGRSLAGALPVARELELDDVWIVASNGAVVAHLQGSDYEITDQHDLDAELAVRLALVEQPGIRIAAEVVGVGYHVNVPFPGGALPGQQRSVEAMRDLWSHRTPRVALHGPGAHRLVRPLRALGLTVNLTRSDWVDVTPPALSKATALDKVRRQLGVEYRATAAIGDGENDLEMLRWATQSIAMGHAPAPVQDVAGRTTGSIDDDGAASALLSLLG